MARLGVTYQDIANAADQLIGQGKQPTIELIRNLLGTGSTTTIANHLRQWRGEQDGSTSIANKENLPQEFISVMKGLWQRLQTHADNQVANIKHDAEQVINQLRQEADNYKNENQRWQKMHDALAREKDELAREKLGLDAAIVLLQKNNAALTAKSDAEQLRIEELNRLHTLAQENLEHFRESTRVQRLMEQEKHAQQLQQFEFSLKNAEQKLANSNQETVVLRTQLDKANNESRSIQTLYDAVTNKFETLRAEFTTLEKEHSVTMHDAKHWQLQHKMLQNKWDDQSILLLEQQKHNAVLVQQLLIAHGEVKELKDQNKFLAREKWEIAQEKAQLEGINNQIQKMILINPVKHEKGSAEVTEEASVKMALNK